jgi:hypothetical protein
MNGPLLGGCIALLVGVGCLLFSAKTENADIKSSAQIFGVVLTFFGFFAMGISWSVYAQTLGGFPK